jgi:hypothetical protein
VTAELVGVSPAWLALREPADAAARAADLVGLLRRRWVPGRTGVVHDLGSGTGSMARWLAPLLAGPQHWVLHDRDPVLLQLADANPPHASAGTPAATYEARLGDITALDPDDLAGASLVTASALIDLVTADELERLVATVSAVGCPVLVTVSVVGRVELAPADPFDATVARAFNDHQRRTVDGRQLLGPDGVGVAVDAFSSRGAHVVVRDSPWRLDGRSAALVEQWFAGWVGAACEQDPDLAAQLGPYTRLRAERAARGRLGVTVHHQDLLVLPR